MLVTKLKNSPNAGWILTVVLLLCCAIGMVRAYPVFAVEQERILSENQADTDALTEVVLPLNEGNYILYNEVSGETDRLQIQEEYGEGEFYLLRKYLDYEVFDWEGEALLGSADESVQRKLVQEDCEYMLRVKFLFAADGVLDNVEVDGDLNERAQYDLEQTLLRNQYWSDGWEYLSTPNEVMIIYGITEENMGSYWGNFDNYMERVNVISLSNSSVFLGFELAFFGIVIAAALLIPCSKTWGIGKQRIFRAPLEIVLCAVMLLIGLLISCVQVVWNTLDGSLAEALSAAGIPSYGTLSSVEILNVLLWFTVFAAAYWCTVCLRAVFTMRADYFRKRTLVAKGWYWLNGRGGRYGEKMKAGADGVAHGLGRLWGKCKKYVRKTYEKLLHLDFQSQANRTILKVVALNFVILVVCGLLGPAGILILLVYSIILCWFLRKYFRDLSGQYQTLLKSTRQMAEGNLDAPLNEDYGIFDPMGVELNEIRSGFKKAVEKEVKSERMKTELITNVSHDLKTPLTAIITYIDLLKQEEDSEKQKEYIEVLERKSQRLKVLIEDLFEVSRATSRNITMNFVKVDIVGLLKQVGLEYDNKIKETNLEFRWKLPEEKLYLWLDSQKTYRIFENLIVNITKYAMPHTRVYIELTQMGEEVQILMKNVSAAELNFDTEEITDRFVRGDASRNTEGSGLGLAIARSFTELQHGKLTISTDADLFKAKIVFPSMKEGTDGAKESEKNEAGSAVL